jgi:hypothetical protein
VPAETRTRGWLPRARARLRHLFPCLPQQPAYNKRLRKAAGLIRSVTRILAAITSVWSDDVRVVDSAPVGCGRPGRRPRRGAGCAARSATTTPRTGRFLLR